VSAVGSHLELIEADATGVGQAAGALAAYRGQVDIVVTNPPYVPQDAVPREPEVRDHDPVLALYGGPDGLSIIRHLIDQAASLLRPGGLLLIEHADVQGEAAGNLGVPGVLRAQRRSSATRSTDPAATASQAPAASEAACPWRDVADHLDLAGRPRHTWAIRA
jgi:release factor glutamine methyltransferase